LKVNTIATLMMSGAILLAVESAQAGAIRSAGNVISRTSTAVADAAGNGMATGGKATGGAVKSGASGLAKRAKATPRLAYRGTKGAGRAIAKALW